MKTIKMKRAEPTKPGGPVTADVHPDEVQNWMGHGWMLDEPLSPGGDAGDLTAEIEAAETIEELRGFADANGLRLHHKAVNFDKAKLNLLAQMA